MKFVLPVIGLLGQMAVAGVGAADVLVQQQVEADHAALQAAERDYRSRLQRGELSGAAASDYEAYVGFLRERLVAGCHALLAAGEALKPDSPCLGEASAIPLAAEGGEAPPGRAERQAALDAELDAAMAEFDEMLLREQQRVRAASPPARESRAAPPGSDGEGASGGDVEADSGGAAAGGAASSDDSTAAPNQDRRAASTGPGAGGGSEADMESPPDVDDASGDDVVARQLREAAEQERDPALKKKLWEEYRRYKQGIH